MTFSDNLIIRLLENTEKPLEKILDSSFEQDNSTWLWTSLYRHVDFLRKT